MVQRREQRKTQTGAGTAAQVLAGLETVAASAMEMYKKDGAEDPYNKLYTYSKIALYIALQRTRLVPRRM